MFVLQAFLRPEQKIVVFLVPQTVIWEAWCLNLCTLGSYFAILGAPWATLGAAGRTCGDPGSHFCRFWHDLGPHSESFSGTNGKKFGVVSRFGSMPFSTPISGSKSGHLGLPKRGFRMEGIAKTNFSQKPEISRFED